MIDPEDYTREERREVSRTFIEIILVVLVILLCVEPLASDWGNSIVENRRKRSALAQTYETLDTPIVDVTFENGVTYNGVKTIYKRDWDDTHWAGQRPDIGYWCTEDGRVIIRKGSCNAIQSVPEVSDADI